MSNGCRVLNLFAYTGSFSVYAAAGGAAETLTVDLSPTYLGWARDNMVLNGFTDSSHRFEQADVVTWLRDAYRSQTQFDVIVLDPPTFSNSKRTALSSISNGTILIFSRMRCGYWHPEGSCGFRRMLDDFAWGLTSQSLLWSRRQRR